MADKTMPPNPGKHDQAIVRGANKKLYVIDKKGRVTMLSDTDAIKLNKAIELAEDQISLVADGMGDANAKGPKTVSGGVNLCVPEMFP
jgi:hypothetical protein